jgi:putative flippase GtrA
MTVEEIRICGLLRVSYSKTFATYDRCRLYAYRARRLDRPSAGQKNLATGAVRCAIAMSDPSSSSADRVCLSALGYQFSRFLAVGVAATVVHYAVLIALVEAWGINPVWATTGGFLTAVVLSYVLNRRYTFEERPAFSSGLLKYYAAVSVGLALNTGVMAALTACGFHYLPAQVTASGVALVWNFLAARFVVFIRGATPI